MWLLGRAQRIGDRNFEYEAWQGLGRVRHATGQVDAAVRHHHRALALAKDLGQLADRARAHDGLAHAYLILGQRELARSHWQHALDILDRLGVAHTEDEHTTTATIHAQLAELEQRQQDPYHQLSR